MTFSSSSGPLIPIKVLLVDDQEIIGTAIGRMLASEKDINLQFCSDGSRALELAIEIKPQVILQDLVMPGSSGLDLVEQYRDGVVAQRVDVTQRDRKRLSEQPPPECPDGHLDPHHGSGGHHGDPGDPSERPKGLAHVCIRDDDCADCDGNEQACEVAQPGAPSRGPIHARIVLAAGRVTMEQA